MTEVIDFVSKYFGAGIVIGAVVSGAYCLGYVGGFTRRIKEIDDRLDIIESVARDFVRREED